MRPCLVQDPRTCTESQHVERHSGITEKGMGFGHDYEEITVRLSFSPTIDGLIGERIIIAMLAAAREHLAGYGAFTVQVQRGSSYPQRPGSSATTLSRRPLNVPESSP